MSHQHPTRRAFLQSTGLAAASLALSRYAPAQATQPAPPADIIAFFFVSDTHYLADKDAPGKLDAASATANSRLIDILNKLPGSTLADSVGGGTVAAPLGVIHGGDCIDNGDKSGAAYESMQKTEWAAFTQQYGLSGKDGQLKYPVYEVYGNHDAPGGSGVVIDGIIERNKKRPGVKNISASGLHYSWDWGDVHFVNLGIVVAADPAVTRKRRYGAHDSLAFLREDLARNVGNSGRSVILTHHVDVARYTGPCDPAAPYDQKEWDPCDVKAYHQCIKDYNVRALFYGHTHARRAFTWDGSTTTAKAGLNVFNVDECAHFKSIAHGFFYVEVGPKKLRVCEYATEDNWATAKWTVGWERDA